MRITAAVLALAAAFGVVAAPALGAPAKVVSDAVSLPPGFSHLVVHSEIIGRDFEIWVNTPLATAFLPGQKFPAIYALDSGYGLAGPQGTLLAGTGAMGPAIIVSVASATTPGLWRNTDLLHNKTTVNGITMGGGGAAFEAFLQTELKPLIEARYPADPRRAVLFGHSFGGLFAANVFANNPSDWAGYIIGSPSVWADPGLVQRVAQAAAKAKDERVYLSVGEFEDRTSSNKEARMRNGFNGLVAALKNRPGVILKTQVYSGETHLSYYPRLITDGFPFVLPPARVLGSPFQAVAAKDIARYAGVYDMPDGRKVTVKAMPDGQLSGQVTGLPMVPLLPNGPDRFYAPPVDLNVVFDAAGATVTGGGGKLRIEKEKAATPAPAS